MKSNPLADLLAAQNPSLLEHWANQEHCALKAGQELAKALQPSPEASEHAQTPYTTGLVDTLALLMGEAPRHG